jgi:hypothetical protein
LPEIVIEFPTAEEEERTRRFQVHKNYLLGLSQHLQERYGEGLDDASRGLIEELRRHGHDLAHLSITTPRKISENSIARTRSNGFHRLVGGRHSSTHTSSIYGRRIERGGGAGRFMGTNYPHWKHATTRPRHCKGRCKTHQRAIQSIVRFSLQGRHLEDARLFEVSDLQAVPPGASGSAWTAAGAGWTTSSSNDCGGASSTKRCT